ncbi:MAG: hypothetical protein HQ596_04520 [Candidatus Saganbacteria bacterium]|nr:hypothetical protein [Candidatus Saganbacteria bacterium]
MEILLGILNSVKGVFFAIVPLLLNLLCALVLLLIGLLIAKGLQWLTLTVFGAVQLDKGCKKIAFTDLLTKGGLNKGPTELLGDLIYWLTIFVTVTAVVAVFGLISANALLVSLLAYLPAVLSAAYILGVGIFVAILLSTIVLVIVNNIGLPNANTLAKIVQYAIIIFAFLAALSQLGISLDWIIASITVVVGAVALTFALAFGLGAKDMATDFLEKFFG